MVRNLLTNRGEEIKILLFTLQITCELDSVSETSQGVHAVQHVWVQLSQGQDSSYTHPPRGRLLRTRLVATPPGDTHAQLNMQATKP